MIHRLAVWLGGEQVGDLVRERRGFRFHPFSGASQLSIADDADGGPWPPAFSSAWFDGLLPEGDRRSVAEIEHGIDRGDSFGLLAQIGWECAGAVSVMPEGRQPASGSYRPLTDHEVWTRLDALPRTDPDLDESVRFSLGGLQEKLLLIRRDDTWLLPLDGAVSTHIMKPDSLQYPGLAVAEAWALTAARAVTETAVSRLATPAEHRAALIVERYDRKTDEHAIARIHQEDLCQILGLPPESKYPRSSGPREASLGRLAAKLVARGEDAPADLVRLLEQTVVNIALGNTDAHAKNISVLRVSPTTVRLSPLYDVVPVLFFLPAQRRAALSVAGKWRIDEITRRHLLDEAVHWGVPRAVALSTIDTSLGRLEDGLSRAGSDHAVPAALLGSVWRQFERLATSEV